MIFFHKLTDLEVVALAFVAELRVQRVARLQRLLHLALEVRQVVYSQL